MGSFYTESSYNFGTNSAQFPADRERCQGETAERYKGEAASGTREKPRARYKGEAASGTRERPRAIQRRGRERYKENKEDVTAGDRKDDSVSPTVPSPIRLRTV